VSDVSSGVLDEFGALGLRGLERWRVWVEVRTGPGADADAESVAARPGRDARIWEVRHAVRAHAHRRPDRSLADAGELQLLTAGPNGAYFAHACCAFCSIWGEASSFTPLTVTVFPLPTLCIPPLLGGSG
jgi:hypothetical protein